MRDRTAAIYDAVYSACESGCVGQSVIEFVGTLIRAEKGESGPENIPTEYRAVASAVLSAYRAGVHEDDIHIAVERAATVANRRSTKGAHHHMSKPSPRADKLVRDLVDSMMVQAACLAVVADDVGAEPGAVYTELLCRLVLNPPADMRSRVVSLRDDATARHGRDMKAIVSAANVESPRDF